MMFDYYYYKLYSAQVLFIMCSIGILIKKFPEIKSHTWNVIYEIKKRDIWNV